MTTGGTTTTTVYVGSLESVATTGATTTTTTYYYAAGQRIAIAVNGTLSYLASDLLGSASVALDGTGLPTASQLYAPYGGVRYSNGAMPTDYGFTGQRNDATTELDYYGARYYDPTLGQFTSADTVMDGLNRYGYVGGNPISRTDPSGQSEWAIDPGMIGGFAPASTGDTAGIGIAGFLLGLSSATTTTPATVPLAGTPGPAATFSVNGATISVEANGDLVVTTYGAGHASTTTSYTAGEAGWLKWSQAISAAYADTDYWNARTAPHATTSTGIPVSVVAPNPGSGSSAGSGAGMSNPGGFPAGPGMQIPATTPPIGIAVGIDVGITSVDVGGTVALEWLLGTLYAKKADLKQLRAAARQAGIKDEEDFRDFGDWVEQVGKPGEGRGGKDHYSFKELVELAKEWLEPYR